MAIDIGRRTTKQYLNEDQRWLKGGILLAPADSILLDRGLFADASFPDGYYPSGLFLGLVTATGLYGPWDDAAVDGRTVARGLLLTSTPYDRDSSGNIGAALAVRCDVITNYLPTGVPGAYAAAVEADLPHVRFHTYNV